MKNRIPNFDDFSINEANSLCFMKHMKPGTDPYSYFLNDVMMWDTKFSRNFKKELKDKGVITGVYTYWREYPKEDQERIIKFFTPFIEEFTKWRTIKKAEIFKYLKGCEGYKDIGGKDTMIMIGDVTDTPLEGRQKLYINTDFQFIIDTSDYPSNFRTGDKPKEYLIVYQPIGPIALFKLENGKTAFETCWSTSMNDDYQKNRWLNEDVKIKKTF